MRITPTILGLLANRIFFGAETYADIQKGSAYQYYAVAEEVSIESAYYIEPGFPQDWAAVKLDRNIGNKTGWYGKSEIGTKTTLQFILVAILEINPKELCGKYQESL